MRQPTRKYVEWAQQEPSALRLVVTLVPAGVLVLAGLPLLIAVVSGWLDRVSGLPGWPAGVATTVAAVVLMVAGGGVALWSVLAEARVGHGTPVPLIPTQRLVVVPPFTNCRNPMALGSVGGYLGFGVWLGSVSAIALVLLAATLLLVYVKVFEEKKLEARFGADYLEYKRATPFLLPRLTNRPQGT